MQHFYSNCTHLNLNSDNGDWILKRDFTGTKLHSFLTMAYSGTMIPV